jgi:hypothetical protein
MTEPIQDVSSLPGKKVSDQQEVQIGEVKDIYATDGHPAWVAVETSTGIGEKRAVFIPLARMKEEKGEIRVPYSRDRILDSPEVEGGDTLSEEDSRALRDYYGIDLADQELRSDNDSYATMMPDEAGEAERVEDVDSLETPDPDKVDDETRARLEDPGSSEARKTGADELAEGDQGGSEGESEDGSEGRKEDGEPEGREDEDSPEGREEEDPPEGRGDEDTSEGREEEDGASQGREEEDRSPEGREEEESEHASEKA